MLEDERTTFTEGENTHSISIQVARSSQFPITNVMNTFLYSADESLTRIVQYCDMRSKRLRLDVAIC